MNLATEICKATMSYSEMRAIEQAASKRINEKQNRPLGFHYPVITNEGTELQVWIQRNTAFFQPINIEQYPFDKKTNSFTVRRGSRSRPREYFTINVRSMMDSDENHHFNKTRNDNVREHLILMPDEIEQECMKLLNDPVRKAMYAAHSGNLYDNLIAQGWDIPEGLDFTKFNWNGWILTSGPDGFGHACGTATRVDPIGKKISIYGWSSDD